MMDIMDATMAHAQEYALSFELFSPAPFSIDETMLKKSVGTELLILIPQI